jgi:glycosyltransferase involved in cell wall biosynthesis
LNNKSDFLYQAGLRTKNIFKKSSNDYPLVSIITVIKNNKTYIEETIQSILNQTYKNIEYIVIDGASDDGSLNIVKKYEDKIDYIISQNDSGLYDAMNKGLDLCSGDLIGIVNSDDVLMPKATNYLIDYYKKNPELDFFFGTVKKHWGTIRGFDPSKIFYSWRFYTSHSTGFFIKKRAATIIGKYSLKYKYCSDFDYFFRMIVKHKMKGIASTKNELFGIFRKGGFSNKSNFWVISFEESQIRIDNKQNKLIVLILLLIKITLNLRFIKTFKIKILYNFLKINYL